MGLPQPALAAGTLRKPLLAVSSDPGRKEVLCDREWPTGQASPGVGDLGPAC